MATLPPIPQNISQATAPLLFGALLNYALFGVLVIQVYIYHVAFPADERKFKALVYGILILETTQVSLCAADIYYWFATGYGNLIHLGNTYFSPFDTPLLGSATAFIVQLFFCYRIWTLRKRAWWLSIFIACVSAAQLVGGVLGGIRAHLKHDFTGARDHIEDLYLWLIGNAFADLLIATTLTFLLLRGRRQDQQYTNGVLIRIVRLVMETNCLTAGVAILSVVLFIASPQANYFVCPTMFFGKLYSNSLLATFNNRLFFNRTTFHEHGISSFEVMAPSFVNLTSSKNRVNSSSSVPSNFEPRDMVLPIVPQGRTHFSAVSSTTSV